MTAFARRGVQGAAWALLAFGFLTACGATPAQAGYGINAREQHQAERIANGIRSGSLTPGEAVNLERQQGRIERLERSFRADGHLGYHERAVLESRLNHASRNIYADKHNCRRR